MNWAENLVVICLLMLPTQLVNAHEASLVQRAMKKTYEPIDISLFKDSIHHWQMKDGRDREDARYAPNQIVHIAENLLKFQNKDGGWSPNLDWLAVLSYNEVFEVRGTPLSKSSFDNRNTYPQIDYLAKVYQVTGIPQYRESVVHGLEYILKEQRSTGGWRGRDADAITFNDDVMVGIMTLLVKIKSGAPQYDWLDNKLRDRLEVALDKSILVTLKCQIVVEGQKTAWCQQHDHLTFKPVKARTFELPSITASESTGVVKFLMTIENPSQDVIDSIESAVSWMNKSKIKGKRLVQFPIKANKFEQFTAKYDRKVVEDSSAPPLWARFYEVETNRPFFCNRDGIKVYQLAEVSLERRAGYAWYGSWPRRLLNKDYPAWKKRLEISK